MTGEKNRFKTHEQLWKLDDGELSTPQHDELVLHLMNPNNLNKLNIFKKDNLFNIIETSKGNTYYEESNLDEFSVYNKLYTTTKEIIESQLYDLIVEKPIKSGNFIVGYADVFLNYYNEIFISEYDYFVFYYQIIIEAKPKIKSFGETLRQLRTYQEYCPRANIFLYSPDQIFKKAFESQGIGFITPFDLGIK
jgi:hypothetical protein